LLGTSIASLPADPVPTEDGAGRVSLAMTIPQSEFQLEALATGKNRDETDSIYDRDLRSSILSSVDLWMWATSSALR
jgi:hypothetical protein